jgi:hypothetical protein
MPPGGYQQQQQQQMPGQPYYGQQVMYGAPGGYVQTVTSLSVVSGTKKKPWEGSEWAPIIDPLGVPRWGLAQPYWNVGWCSGDSLRNTTARVVSDDRLDAGQKQLIVRYLEQVTACCCCRTDKWCWIFWCVGGLLGIIEGCMFCAWEEETQKLEAAYQAESKDKWKD